MALLQASPWQQNELRTPHGLCLLVTANAMKVNLGTAMFAAHNNLNNLVTIVDRNYQCVTDFTETLLRWNHLTRSGAHLDSTSSDSTDMTSALYLRPLIH